MSESDYIVFIQKDVIYDIDVSNEAIFVYLAINSIIYDAYKCFLSYNRIGMEIFEKECTATEKRVIKKGFNELVDKGFIEILCDINGHDFLCNVPKIKEYNKEYIHLSIKKSELKKIMNMDNINKIRILRYFILLTGTFDGSHDTEEKYRFKIGKLSVKSISTILGISVATVIKYNKILEQEHILYISRNRIKNKTVGTVSGVVFNQDVNTYSRYEDKGLCDQYVEECKYKEKTKEELTVTLNENRKYSQMYNVLVKRAKQGAVYYDEKTAKDIYEHIKLWNKSKQDKYDEDIVNKTKAAPPKLKDLSVFSIYSFYNNGSAK